MSVAKRVVLLPALALFAVWMGVHWGRLTGDADALIRFTLGILFAVLVIVRPNNLNAGNPRIPDLLFPVALAAGTLAALGGIIFQVHMLEWVGVLLLIFAGVFWGSPRRFRADLLRGVFILFWVHPIPGSIFGWMQGLMQRLSVVGSELILHAFNVRIWGDGTVLRSGYQNFLVPDACSGMRTSVTVFLCVLGVGLLLRLRWWETLGFVVLGLAQVLILNIARISYMVLWAPRMPPEWAENFLHDTLGIFLLGAIAMVQMEAAWWHWWSRRRAFIREGIRTKELEGPDKSSIIPHPLRKLGTAAVVLSSIGLIGFGVFVIIYKSRAFHHKEMVRDVATGLMETDPAAAYRAFAEVRRFFPKDTELISLQATTDFILGRFEEGLALLDKIESLGTALSLGEVITKGWALTRVGRLAEARALVGTLAPENDRIPGVAMLKAEFAAMDGQPAIAAQHMQTASRSHMMLPRIRALFPYLARHEQWRAIAESDQDRPYAELYQALIALHANQQVNNLSGLTRVMEQAIKAWPDDQRLMGALFEIAARRRGGDWVKHFERNFRANAGRLAVDSLATTASYGWRLMRPDLAWLAHLQLSRIAPNDPELLMAPARYGRGWTQFRRHPLAVQADTEDRIIDLAPVLNLFAQTRPIRDFRRRIPLIDEIAKPATDRQAARRYLELGLAALQKQETEGALSERCMRLYPMTLAMLNRYDEAHERLDRIVSVYPEQHTEVLFQHAALYDQQAAWQKSYEALGEYGKEATTPTLTAELLKISALMNMNLGVCAMQVLDDARRAFPGAIRLDLAESAIWDVFGYKDQGLHVLSQSAAGDKTPAALGLLYATGRLTEAQQLSASLALEAPEGTVKVDPPMWLPPAGFALTPRWPPPPDKVELNARVNALRGEYEKATSPFIKALRGQMLAWAESLLAPEGYAAANEPQTAAQITRWEELGRTPLEKTGALYELAMLAARQKDTGLAQAALRRALEFSPSSAVVWRALIALSGRDAALLGEATARCPHDPEVFLAGLVLLTEDGQDQEARLQEAARRVESATESSLFSPETLIRAGDLMLAKKKPALADKLAQAALPRARGLLAAHVLSLRTALQLGDADRALTAAIRSVEQARDPVPFYRVIVDIKIARRQVDNDLIAALEYLQANRKDDPRWAEALGTLYFQRGDMRRALTIFGSVIDEDIKGVQVRTLLMAAEAARLDSKSDQAIRILEDAYALQPGQISVLNNLVYMLAQNPRTLPRARNLLPKLLEVGGDQFAVMDTAAMVALRSGDTAQAALWMEKSLSMLKEGEYGVREVQLNAAELKLRSGDGEGARAVLDKLRSDPQRSDYIDQRAKMLLRDIDMTDAPPRWTTD